MFFSYFRGSFLGNFWVFEIFRIIFVMRIYDFGGVYLVKLFHWSTPSMIFCFLVILGGYFLGNFWVFEIFETVFEMTIYDFGGLFIETYSFKALLYLLQRCYGDRKKDREKHLNYWTAPSYRWWQLKII